MAMNLPPLRLRFDLIEKFIRKAFLSIFSKNEHIFQFRPCYEAHNSPINSWFHGHQHYHH